MIMDSISHYRILSKLGAGGMGEVYLAEDTRLERKVALKVLPASYQYDPERRDRFLREARAASALRSPNVAAIYDIGEQENAMFIAMEYVEGELLATRLAHGPLEINEAVDISIQVAEALEEAHSLGIVHRDIKSSNVIVSAHGMVKVLDFGLAKMDSAPGQSDDRTAPLGMATSPGVILGTVAYMSPEQARGQEVDGRTDLFSLGVLLYEMLTGKQPFEGGTTGDLLVAILNQEPLLLAQHSSEIPPEMQWIVSKALRKDKALRYQTARDFIVDLRNLSHGLKTTILQPMPDSDSANRAVGRTTRVRTVRKDSVHRARRHKAVDSIAVLPFEIEGGEDADIEYLSDGITESLINTLSRIPKLRVMARSTVFRYKGRDFDPRQVGAELNVRAVMTGRMRQIGEQFLIGAELVDVNDGAQLWGEQYKRSLSGIVTLQEEISNDIGEKLSLKLTSGEKRRLASPKPENTGAYELYLKGRHNWRKFTEEGLRDAIAYFEQALGKDPGFALAYSGLGDAYGVLSYLNPDPSEAHGAMLRSKACAKRAVELDAALPEAHLTLANIAHLHDWDWPQAEREFKLAIELNPNLAAAHQGYGLFLMDQRAFEEAMVEMELALQLDPMSLPINASMGYLLFATEQYQEAANQLASCTELDPNLQLTHQMLAASLERLGKYSEAVSEYLKMIPEGLRGSEMAAALNGAFAESGMNGFLHKFAELAHELSEQRQLTSLFVATIHISLGELEAAFAWIEKAFGERMPALSHIKADPRFSALRSDPRYRELLRRMGLSE